MSAAVSGHEKQWSRAEVGGIGRVQIAQFIGGGGGACEDDTGDDIDDREEADEDEDDTGTGDHGA